MQRLLFLIAATVFISGTNAIFIPDAKAAAVNCSYDVCMKQCVQKGASGNGCFKFCNDAMTERKNAGQCKK